MVKWIAWDMIDVFKGPSLHGKLKEMEVIWPFTTQPLLPLVSAFHAVALLTFYVSDTILLFGEEEIPFLRGESKQARTNWEAKEIFDCNYGRKVFLRRKSSCHLLTMPRKLISLFA